MTNSLEDVRTFQKVDQLMRVLRSAVREAQEESRRLGVPNVYSIDGHIYFEMPDGEYCRRPPMESLEATDANPRSDSSNRKTRIVRK
jgi:hypothetical protein